MPRKKTQLADSIIKNQEKGDPLLNDVQVARFARMMMLDGKLQKSYNILIKALSIISDPNAKAAIGKSSFKCQQVSWTEDRKERCVQLFDQIITAASPAVETKGKRVGSANILIPVPVSGKRKFKLAALWIIESSRKKVGAMSTNLAKEFFDILDGKGATLAKRESVHKNAQSNVVNTSIN
jgi:ribosomal protein S7